jgi:hypothetical protein
MQKICLSFLLPSNKNAPCHRFDSSLSSNLDERHGLCKKERERERKKEMTKIKM